MLHFILRSMRSSLQQLHRRQLLKLFVLCLLTINSDATLVPSAFRNIQCSSFTSRWLLSVRPFGLCCTHLLISSSEWSFLLIRNTALKRRKKILLEEYSFMYTCLLWWVLIQILGNLWAQNEWMNICGLDRNGLIEHLGVLEHCLVLKKIEHEYCLMTPSSNQGTRCWILYN